MRNSPLSFFHKLCILILVCGFFALFSCQKESEPLIIDSAVTIDITPEEEDCYYVFPEGLDFIFGSWASIKVIDYVYGDTTYYDVDEGHGGFQLGGHYSDSFELKDNWTFNLFYTRVGRKCKDVEWGEFEYLNDTLTFYRSNGLIIDVPVIHLVEDTLVIEDVLNHHPSKITMLRIN